MAISSIPDDLYEKVVDVLALFDRNHPKLSAWEREQFLPSLSEKHNLYHQRLLLSPKQYEIIDRILTKCK